MQKRAKIITEQFIFGLLWLGNLHLIRCSKQPDVQLMHTTQPAEKIIPFGGLNFCLNRYHHYRLAGNDVTIAPIQPPLLPERRRWCGEANANRFFTRVRRLAGHAPADWQVPNTRTQLGWQLMDVTEIARTPLCRTKSYCMIVSRIKQRVKQGDQFSGGTYIQRAIINNDHKTDSEQIIAFYTIHGGSGRLFDVMNNNFGWIKLPFQFLSLTTSFMKLRTIITNIYRYIIGLYSHHIAQLSLPPGQRNLSSGLLSFLPSAFIAGGRIFSNSTLIKTTR